MIVAHGSNKCTVVLLYVVMVVMVVHGSKGGAQ